ncbi:hypothetical protein JZ751_014088 [Albula glossodonta]|uniref:Uncharacterized protein n=1 Tax=Albula glossodonta TaxID=121402 RepID=A0A8T2NUE2_9TELE|nr:hypothetical protein JZ751_014088 [Albula glossodonta]
MNRPGKRTRRKVVQIRQEWKDPVCRPSHRDPERAQTPLEGRQWGVERTTRDTFPARTMNPQGRHPTRPKCLFHRCILFPPMAPLTSGHGQPHTHCQALGRRRIIDTIEQVPWETRSTEVCRQQNVDPVTLRRRIHNLLRDSVVVDFRKSERLARGPLERTSHVINPPG